MSRANQRRIDPAIRKQARQRSLKRMGRVIVFALMMAVSGGSAIWLNQKWSVQHWQIKAQAPLKGYIEAQLKHMPSRDFLSTRPDVLRQQWMNRIPDLAAVRITRILPDRLQIEAEARVPTALWQDEQSRLHLFDAQGHAYRLLRKGESPDLPLLRVAEEQLPAMQNMLQTLSPQALTALSEVRAGNGHWQMYFAHGESWLIAQRDANKSIVHITSLLKQPRWKNRHWRVDARLASRWFIRPAGRGGVI